MSATGVALTAPSTLHLILRGWLILPPHPEERSQERVSKEDPARTGDALVLRDARYAGSSA